MSTLNRRDFIKVLGVSSAASAVACDPTVPTEFVLPYVVQPEQIIPGVSTWIATQCNECSEGCGVLARNREGRVVKLEGNPRHPTNEGKLCAQGQAAILDTYSPDRISGPGRGGSALSWQDALKEVSEAVALAKRNKIEVAWLGTPKTGATGTLIRQFVDSVGGTVLHWDPLESDGLRAATRKVFGRQGAPAYRLAKAHTIVSFGANFLATWGGIRLEREWANSRDPKMGGFVSRTVCIEPRVGNTSSIADLYLAAIPGTEAGVALALARLVADKLDYDGPASAAIAGVDPAALAKAADVSLDRLKEIAGWLADEPSVVLPGGVVTSAAATQLATATLLLNEVAGNIGETVVFGPEPNVAGRASTKDVLDLLERCVAGKVGVLFLDGLDPEFTLPGGAKCAESLKSAGLVVAFVNEPCDSLSESTLILPPGTTLENWGDSEAIHGVHTLQQPAMLPVQKTSNKDPASGTAIHSTLGIGDVLLQVAKAAGLEAVAPAAAPVEASDAADADAGEATDATEAAEMVPAASPPDLAVADFRTYLQDWWKAIVWPKSSQEGTFKAFWERSLKAGGHFDQVPVESVECQAVGAVDSAAATPSGDGLILTTYPHPFVGDGRHANKPWAQEVPDPISSYAWGTWVEVHPETAAKHNLVDDQLVKVTTDSGSIEVSWFGSPAIRKDTIAIVMGNGHQASGRYATVASEGGAGGNPMRLLPVQVDEASGCTSYVSTRAKIAGTGNKSPLHQTIGSMDQDGRPINFTVSASDLGKGTGPHSIVPMHHPPVDQRVKDAGLDRMYPLPAHPRYRFAMSIDLNRCTGCGACETACYAENNVPIVGPEQIAKSRRMGWIRISRYWEGEGDNPDVRFQPVMCQQCSHAPCEGVCPVLATYHTQDGLNAMIYNRCVGTRYCANNCPYSARRFNYHSYQWPSSFNLMLNPDVVTREMGIMEKCTFCIQRIREVKDRYRDQGKLAPDTALRKLPACAQTCPTNAMTFGNLNDEKSRVYTRFHDERSYEMLSELNTSNGVAYLARIHHGESKLHGHGHGGGHGDGHDVPGHGGDSHGSDAHGGGH